MAEQSTADRILDAVVEILGTRGLECVTIRDVASTAGFSVGAVQHHFPTKQQMLVAALDQAAESIITGYDRALQDTADPTDRLDAAVTMLATVGQTDRPAAVVWTALASQSMVDPEIRTGFTRMQQGIRRWMEGRVVEAQPSVPDPGRLATLLVAAAQGLMVTSASEDDGISRDVTARMADQVLRGVTGAAPDADAARARADTLFDELARRLADEDPVAPDILRLRRDLAVAEAEARLTDRALYQFDELLADATRALAPEDPLLAALRRDAATWYETWGQADRAAAVRGRT